MLKTELSVVCKVFWHQIPLDTLKYTLSFKVLLSFLSCYFYTLLGNLLLSSSKFGSTRFGIFEPVSPNYFSTLSVYRLPPRGGKKLVTFLPSEVISGLRSAADPQQLFICHWFGSQLGENLFGQQYIINTSIQKLYDIYRFI